MGLILRGDTWHMKFAVKGEKVQESCYTSNRREAENIMAKARAELVQSVVLAGKKPIKLHDAIDEFLRVRKEWASYTNACTHMKHWKKLPNTYLNHVTDNSLQTAIEERYEAGWKKSTVGTFVGYFNAVLAYADEKGYTVRKKLPPVKGIKSKIRWLTDAEEAAFMYQLHPDTKLENDGVYAKGSHRYEERRDNWDLCLLLSHTGARYSEIGNMTWGQVDFTEKTVLIKRGKGGNDSTMHMTPMMEEVLVRRRQSEKQAYVFSSKVGRHNETKWVHAAVKRAGLSTVDGSISLHTLRHSRAVKWLMKGLNLLEVKEMLGHKSIASTMVYVHLVPGSTAKKARDLI